MYYCGATKPKIKKRKQVRIPRRMFVNGKSKKLPRGRFGLMCFSANRNKNDWDRCECDHINGDRTDEREENVRWLTPAENKSNYHNIRARRSHAARV